MRFPVKKPLVMDQGQDWSFTTLWKKSDGSPEDLTGFSARMQVREARTDNVLVELTNSNNRIALAGVSGLVTLKLTASESGALLASTFSNPHLYDLELVASNGVVTKLLNGILVNRREVTR